VLYIHDLQYANKIEYEIYDLEGYHLKYSNTKDIAHNGSVSLYTCPFYLENKTYRILYYTYHCDGSKRSSLQDFTVIGWNGGGKSPTDDPDDPENPTPALSPSANNTIHQDETAVPNFTVTPNPNAGTFQLETNSPYLILTT